MDSSPREGSHKQRNARNNPTCFLDKIGQECGGLITVTVEQYLELLYEKCISNSLLTNTSFADPNLPNTPMVGKIIFTTPPKESLEEFKYDQLRSVPTYQIILQDGKLYVPDRGVLIYHIYDLPKTKVGGIQDTPIFYEPVIPSFDLPDPIEDEIGDHRDYIIFTPQSSEFNHNSQVDNLVAFLIEHTYPGEVGLIQCRGAPSYPGLDLIKVHKLLCGSFNIYGVQIKTAYPKPRYISPFPTNRVLTKPEKRADRKGYNDSLPTRHPIGELLMNADISIKRLYRLYTTLDKPKECHFVFMTNEQCPARLGLEIQPSTLKQLQLEYFSLDHVHYHLVADLFPLE